MKHLQSQNTEFEVNSPAWEVANSADCEESPSISRRDLPSLSSPVNRWDPRLILDLAVGVDDLSEILLRYDITIDEYDHISKAESFRRELSLAIRDARENGTPFAVKARVQAESYLEVLDALVYSPNTPASTKLESIRSIVKWGRLEAPKNGEDSASATQVNVNINF